MLGKKTQTAPGKFMTTENTPVLSGLQEQLGHYIPKMPILSKKAQKVLHKQKQLCLSLKLQNSHKNTLFSTSDPPSPNQETNQELRFRVIRHHLRTHKCLGKYTLLND